MPPVLLRTKLFPPPHRPGLVARPRLLKRLNDGLQQGRPVSLISAPAGFGKTTLAVEWLADLGLIGAAQDSGRKLAWLSLDAGDNDLALFLSYLIAALHNVHPGAGQAVLGLLGRPNLPPVSELLLPLINDLAEGGEPFLLALDDYHTLQDPAIHEALVFLLDHQPPGMHTVITTRQDPLLPLARWRARGQLTEIRPADLRFTREEAAEFLNRSMSLELSPEDVSVLEERTEGWIAGLQIAAISLQQAGEAGGTQDFIRGFAGDDRFVLDYLVDEVLSRQPPDVQEFLLKTSVLERFNSALCEYLLDEQPAPSPEESRAHAILAYLDRANLFLVALDNRREWYRYHHLFAELLQYHLRSTAGADAATALRRKAARWFDRHDLPAEAVRYAQIAGDWALSGELIARHSQALVQQGDLATLLRWMHAMPEDAIRHNPVLARDYGYALVSTGKLNLGAEYLRLAETAFVDQPDALGRTLAHLSTDALFRGEFSRQIQLARRALELIDPANIWLRASAALSLGLGLCHDCEIQASEAAFLDAYEMGLQAKSARTCIFALAYLGRISVLHMNFTQAEDYFQQAGHFSLDGLVFPGYDLPLLDLAMLYYEQNDLEGAMECVEQGMQANRQTASVEMGSYGYRIAARICQLRGESVIARQHLRKAVEMAAEFNLSPLTLSLNAALQVQMALTDGDLAAAEGAAPRVTNSLGMYPFIFYPELARVHLHILQGHIPEALELLAPVLPRVEQPGWAYPRLQVRVLQALAAEDPKSALSYLDEALALAQPVGAMRTFLDLGAPMHDLLLGLRFKLPAVRAPFVERLLAAFPAKPGAAATPPTSASAEALVEPLTEREIEVLQLIADGLTNPEIAQKLYLSTNTLKAHTQNIYSKLDVHSRVQAVNRARELGLI